MPVYWFAISQVEVINWPDAALVFIILHLLVYPASNGYNSYMDRDISPIGGISHPLPPTKQLFLVTIMLDVVALALSRAISTVFAVGILLYILASKAYSYRKIRLKKLPVTGYLTVMIFQGAVVFLLVYHGSSAGHPLDAPVWAMLASALLIGGFYPLTQIYQHEADLQDGVVTISYLLGYRGTFIFTGIVYALAFTTMAWYFYVKSEMMDFIILQIFMLPVLAFYGFWFVNVIKDQRKADFKNAMRMNLLASACTNLGFITLLILK